jgi:signal recognition particle subunit SRP54
MFQSFSDKLRRTLKDIRGQGRLTTANVQDVIRDVRLALLDADVALEVVKNFIELVKTRALGEEVLTSLNPGQAFVKIVNDELVTILGKGTAELDLNAQAPIVILLAGLQGSGKTTTTAKLARLLKQHHQKKVLVASTDIYRPAAITQLETLCQQLQCDFSPVKSGDQPTQIANLALQQAKQEHYDILLVDTAGRLHLDEAMMTEIKALHEQLKPQETLFVVDSMTGQDAANTAKAFHQALPLTGVVLTKTDGDARGGAALSINQITGTPIKFMGTGEATDALEAFHPDRIASRILGMGDIVSLVEEAERKIEKSKAKKIAHNIRKGAFTLNDFREQMLQMNNMGGMQNLLNKLPGMGNLAKVAQQKINDNSVDSMIAILNSMTQQELNFPKLIVGSRKRRIALGSGTDIQDINRLLKQFAQMQKMLKKLSKPGAMQKMLRNFSGNMPPNLMGD